MSFSSRRRNYMLVSHRRDQFIEFIKNLLKPGFTLDAMEATADNSWRHVEELIEEHRALDARGGRASRLRENVPTVGTFHTALPLVAAWRAFDARFRLSARRFVAPTFNEIREILNLAQVKAFAGVPGGLRFVSFDGDCTLYSDGKNFDDAALAAQILRLLERGVCVALVTAAGYGYDARKYEKRIEGLLRVFDDRAAPADVLRRFYVCGGECNYLLQLDRDEAGHAALRSREGVWDVTFDEAKAAALLDVAEASLRGSVDDLGMAKAIVIRKKRAVGLYFHDRALARREQLDECVLRAQDALRDHHGSVPFCAFNGGADVWVDIGNKAEGVDGFQRLLTVPKAACLHVGDQFLTTGNDHASRASCPCLWITNPDETKRVLKDVLEVLDADAAPPAAPNTARGRASTKVPPAGP
jgi:IMP and pyridine-specific 5'-nucleotidase